MAFDAQLECFFCNQKFKDFGPLGEHVRREHPEIGAALPSAPDEESFIGQPPPFEEWEEHGWFLGNEDDDMLPPVGGGKTPSQRTGRKGGRGGPAPNVPFITVENLSNDPVTAKILGVEAQTGGGFNDVIVKISIKGRSYFLGLKASNPNYETLINALGQDEKKWIDIEFTIGLNWNEFYEKNFVHIFECPVGTSSEDQHDGRKKRRA
jgi:hypothetical protein